MARTKAQIVTALSADPQYAELADDINGKRIVLTSTQRAQRISQWADAVLAQEQQADTVAALATQFDAEDATLATLISKANTGTTLTAADIRELVKAIGNRSRRDARRPG